MISYNIPHNFDLKGFKIGDEFIGCCQCWFRFDTASIGLIPKCPKCGSHLSILTVTEDDKELLGE